MQPCVRGLYGSMTGNRGFKVANPYSKGDSVLLKSDQQQMTVVCVNDEQTVICSLDSDKEKQERYALDALFDVNSDAQFVHMG